MAIFGVSSEVAGPVAIEAATVNGQALSINAALNKITTTIAGVWDLNETGHEAPKVSNTVFVPHQNLSGESVIEGDDRTLVDPVHFNPGGKYRSIVKLFIKYENLGDNKFAHGTGWLIHPDVLVTAGHNVYSWKQNAGRAREIKVYAGYNGAASINTPAVEFRKAKRVVTTSHWLSNRGSMAHDFALVQLEEPFTTVTPFQYIETPSKDKTKLGVVGYPADKYDEATGEKGGRMYELFEDTEYNIMEQKDTMLQHYIDSNGGNSGGPVLRGSDLVAIATHVYGGDFNTASVLGRYGNPVQDYLAALGLPLVNNGQINLVPVGIQEISQSDAATGPQTAEIKKLGANIPASLGDNIGRAGDPESWTFNDPKQILALARNYRQTLGAGIAVPISAIVAPMVAQAVATYQTGGVSVSDESVVKRAILADAALTAAEDQHTIEEGFMDHLTRALQRGPTISWSDVLSQMGIPTEKANSLVYDIAAEVTRGLVLRSHLPATTTRNKTEAAMDDDAPSTTPQEAALLQALKEATGSQEEGFFSDVGDFFSSAAQTVVNTAADAGQEANKALRTVGSAWDDAVDGAAAKVKEVPVFGDVFGTAVKTVAGKPDAIFHLADQITGMLAKGRAESAFEDGEGMFRDLRASIVVISQAMILRNVIAGRFLDAQMGRPVEELKEEGFFDVMKEVAQATGKLYRKKFEK